ncbi:putative glycine degradation aminomethyltransferase, partial [Rhizobium sp. Pop5]
MPSLRTVVPSLVHYPGIPALPEGTERYRAKGGGSVVVRVEAGDRVSVIDSEGGQICELSFLDEKGRFQAAGLGTAFTNSAEGLKTILQMDDESAARMRVALQRRGADLAAAGALSIFGAGSSPG